MHGTALLTAVNIKAAKDVESLLRWAYLDELPKRKTSSAEGIWDGIAEYGQRGGIDVGHGAAQRYPHFGLPHKDAITIEKAVNALPDTLIDWGQHYDLIAGDLAPLVSINDVQAASASWRSAKAPGDRLPGSGQPNRARPPGNMVTPPDGRGVRVTPAERPRDVILVNSINTEALVFAHATKGTRPGGWRVNDMRAVPMSAERGEHTKIIGICKGKNSYTSGSYCPLRWEPSPLKIIIARSNYFAWHQALTMLSETLELTEFMALPPEASVAPWIEGEKAQRIFHQGWIRSHPLPLKPTRKLAGPPKRRPKQKGRSIAP